MKILKFEKIKKDSCDIYIIHVKINNLKNRAEEMIVTISDTSWINKLDFIWKKTFTATSKKTIEKLVNEIFKKIDSKVTIEFWEYLISDTAQCILVNEFNHNKIPLAELLKEKKSWNHWFDFHTETKTNFVSFGEAKYRSSWSPHSDSINQIADFIKDWKDDADLVILERFISKKSQCNYQLSKKSYVAAFSINWTNVDLIFKNALNNKNIIDLIKFPEFYLIWIELWE